MDTLSPKKRAWVMSRVGSKNTKPELLIRTVLHRQGYRYKLNDKALPGKPDLTFPRHRLAVFIHGCFWHRHKNCRRATMPKSNQEFWQNKFTTNQRKDARAKRRLNAQGWRTLTVWECQIMRDPQKAAARITRTLPPLPPKKTYPLPSRGDLLKAADRKWRYLKDD